LRSCNIRVNILQRTRCGDTSTVTAFPCSACPAPAARAGRQPQPRHLGHEQRPALLPPTRRLIPVALAALDADADLSTKAKQRRVPVTDLPSSPVGAGANRAGARQ
jgi:hypothetical protein